MDKKLHMENIPSTDKEKLRAFETLVESIREHLTFPRGTTFDKFRAILHKLNAPGERNTYQVDIDMRDQSKLKISFWGETDVPLEKIFEPELNDSQIQEIGLEINNFLLEEITIKKQKV